MMQQHQLLEEETLGAERMTEDEARDVVRLWAEAERQRDERKAGVTVGSVAEGLEIPATEAHRLLQKVRQQRATEEVVVPPVEIQRRSINIERPLLAAFVSGLVLAITAQMGMLLLFCLIGLVATLAMFRRWAGLAAATAAIVALGLLMTLRMTAEAPAVAVPVATPISPQPPPASEPASTGSAPTAGGSTSPAPDNAR